LTIAKTKQGLEHLKQVTTLYDPDQHASNALLSGHDPGVLSCCYTGRALWYLGYPDSALRACLDGMAIARKRNHPYSLAFAAASGVSWVYSLRRDYEEAFKAADEGVRLSQEEGFPVSDTLSRFIRAWSRIYLTENEEETLPELRKALSDLRSTGTEITRPHDMSLFVDALFHMGRFEECINEVDQMLSWSRRTGAVFYDPELLRVKAAALQALSTNAKPAGNQSEELLNQSLTLCRTSSNRCWELRSSIDLAELWTARGRPEEAHSLLQGVYSQFTEGFETYDLRRARQLLNNLG